jgi:hypothetical protein
MAAGAIAIGAIFGTVGTGQAAHSTAPSEKNPPTINGTAQEGKTLTADHGDWNGTQPFTYHYQWLRCDTNGGGCAGISTANSRLYDVKSQDVGHTLRVRVTVTNSSGSAKDDSAPTAVVKAAVTTPPPAPTGCPSGSGAINISDLTPPARLLIDGFNSTPSVLGQSVGTLSIRVHVSACGGRSVQGALVYAAAVPFNQFSVTSEQQTGADGWATVNEQQLNGYPASPRQGLLAVMLRARKSGESLLGGVSSRRLVSFRVNLRQ